MESLNGERLKLSNSRAEISRGASKCHTVCVFPRISVYRAASLFEKDCPSKKSYVREFYRVSPTIKGTRLFSLLRTVLPM